MTRESSLQWQVFIDRGGTFCDCIAYHPQKNILRVCKVLSSDQAPISAIRKLLELSEQTPIPPCDLRMGTPVATNALLERKGQRCLWICSQGFADALLIGTQTRSDIFALDIKKFAPLYEEVLELPLRLDSSGRTIADLDEAEIEALLEGYLERGFSN